jgi:hypothetical protein
MVLLASVLELLVPADASSNDSTVAVAINGLAPIGFDEHKLRAALEKYLTEIPWKTVGEDASVADGATFLVTLTWADRKKLQVQITPVGEEPSITFEVPFSPTRSADFYRTVGLKLRSALRAEMVGDQGELDLDTANGTRRSKAQ